MSENADQNRKGRTKGIPIESTKLAVHWRLVFYFMSAAMMGKALADLTTAVSGESLGNVGMALFFAGLAFRSKEAAILVYVQDPKLRDKAMIQARQEELKNRPYVSWIMKAGWLLLVLGVGLEVSTWF